MSPFLPFSLQKTSVILGVLHAKCFSQGEGENKRGSSDQEDHKLQLILIPAQ
jgi:hypothetical protein